MEDLNPFDQTGPQSESRLVSHASRIDERRAHSRGANISLRINGPDRRGEREGDNIWAM